MQNINKTILVAIIIGFNIIIVKSQTLSDDLSKAMALQAKNQYKEGTAKFKQYYESNPQSFFDALKPYCSDTSDKVRSLACSLCTAAAQNLKDDAPRAAAIDLLIGFVTDKNISDRSTAIRALQNFKSSEFTDAHRQRLTEAINGKPYNDIKPAIRLAGFLNLQGLNDFLHGITTDVTLKTRQKWEAYLALARMGDKDAINYIMEKIKTVPLCDDLMYDFVSDLIYTRQKQAFDYIIEILNSDKESCTSSNPNSTGNILCGYRAMEYLAPVIDNYPLKARASGDIDTKDYKEALKTVRKWFKKQKENYKIKDDIF